MTKTVKVKIVVGVNSDGEWSASGWSSSQWSESVQNKEEEVIELSKENVFEDIGRDNVVLYFVTADIEIPKQMKEISGKVENIYECPGCNWSGKEEELCPNGDCPRCGYPKG